MRTLTLRLLLVLTLAPASSAVAASKMGPILEPDG